jgi:hypothetical protein
MAGEQGTVPAVCAEKQNHDCAREKTGIARGARIRAKSKYPWRNMRKDHRLDKEVDIEKYLAELVY